MQIAIPECNNCCCCAFGRVLSKCCVLIGWKKFHVSHWSGGNWTNSNGTYWNRGACCITWISRFSILKRNRPLLKFSIYFPYKSTLTITLRTVGRFMLRGDIIITLNIRTDDLIGSKSLHQSQLTTWNSILAQDDRLPLNIISILRDHSWIYL